ncbi:MAG: hypothetical protein RL278_736 [Actinomycetota bacterium]
MSCTTGRRISRWASLLFVISTLLFSSPSRAELAPPRTLPSAIEARLIGQNFNVTIGKQFRFVVSIPNKATLNELRSAKNAVLRVEVHAAVGSRDAVRDAVSGVVIPNIIETHDLPFASLGSNDAGDVIALLGSNAGGSSVRLRKSGVYPISLSIRVGDNESSRLLTFVNFITVQTSKNTLSVSLVAEVSPALSQTATGEISLTDSTRTTLNNVVSSLNGDSGVMSLRISPETLNSLAISSNPQDAELLGQIQVVLAKHQVLASTFVPFDPSSAEKAKLGSEFDKQLSRGIDILDTRNGDAVINPRTWFSTRPINTDGVALLARSGYTNLVFSPQAAQSFGALDSYTKQYRADYAGDATKKVSVAVADPQYAASLSGGNSNPVQTSMAIAAEIVAQQGELVVGQRQQLDHHLVVSTLDGSVPNPVLLNSLLVALSNAPQITLRPLGSIQRATEASTPLTMPSGAPIDLRARRPQLQSVIDEIASTQTMLTVDAPQRMWWEDSLLLIQSSSLTADRFDTYLKGFRAQLRGFRASVSVPQSLTFTLSGKSSDLRLQLRNSATMSLSVLVTLSSAKLTFPEKPQVVTVAANSAVDVIVPVIARANGTFPLEVVLYTPDGSAQVGKRIRLSARVSALAGLGQLVTGVALLLLASWWVAHWRKQHRAKAVENHPAVR